MNDRTLAAWRSWFGGLGSGDVTLTIRDGALALDDFDDSGLDVDAAALLEASGSPVLYADSDRGGSDVLTEGELGLGAGETVVSQVTWNGSSLKLNDNDNPAALTLEDHFLGTGAPDWRVYVQTVDGVAFFYASDHTSAAAAGGGYVNFTNLPQAVVDLLDGIATGDRFILAAAKAAPNQDPTLGIDTPPQTVDGGAAVQLAATAADPDGSIASYAWAANADVGVFDDAAAEDPTWTAPAAGAAEHAVTLMLTVTDDRDATASARVVITVRPDEIPAGAWVRTVEGDVLDEVCWRHYAREDAVPAVLDANPGLAALGPVLPPGRIVALPDLPVPARQATAVRLWETPGDA